MRKDVRTGAIIGGILVGGLVVYAIVVSTGPTKTPNKPPAESPVALDLQGAKAPIAAPSHPEPTAPDDRAGRTPAPPHDPSADGGVAAAPVPPTPPALPEDPAPTAEPAAGPGSTDWATLLSASHTEGDVLPVRTRTPEPAIPADPAPTPDGSSVPGIVETPPDPTQVADASPTRDSTGGAPGEPTPKPAEPTHGSDAKTPPPPTATPSTHKIAQGETFSSIAREVYGDTKYATDIAKANPALDSSHLKIGMVIALPDAAQIKRDRKPADKPKADKADSGTAAKPPTVLPPVNPKTEYRVQSADSLYKISIKLYHTPSKVDALYDLNKDAIGSDRAKLKLNMVLKLPEPPVETASR